MASIPTLILITIALLILGVSLIFHQKCQPVIAYRYITRSVYDQKPTDETATVVFDKMFNGENILV